MLIKKCKEKCSFLLPIYLYDNKNRIMVELKRECLNYNIKICLLQKKY